MAWTFFFLSLFLSLFFFLFVAQTLQQRFRWQPRNPFLCSRTGSFLLNRVLDASPTCSSVPPKSNVPSASTRKYSPLWLKGRSSEIVACLGMKLTSILDFELLWYGSIQRWTLLMKKWSKYGDFSVAQWCFQQQTLTDLSVLCRDTTELKLTTSDNSQKLSFKGAHCPSLYIGQIKTTN